MTNPEELKALCQTCIEHGRPYDGPCPQCGAPAKAYRAATPEQAGEVVTAETVENETRDLMREAALQDDQKISDWISSRLRKASAPTPLIGSEVGEIVERLREAYCASLGSHQDRAFLTQAADLLDLLASHDERVNALTAERDEAVAEITAQMATIERQHDLMVKLKRKWNDGQQRLSEAVECLKVFALIADMESKADTGASVFVNVERCRDARAFLASIDTQAGGK